MHEARSTLLDSLIQDHLMDETTAKHALLQSNIQNIPLTYYLVKNNLASSESIFTHYKKIFAGPSIEHPAELNRELTEDQIIHKDLIVRYRALPLECNNGNLLIALADPADEIAIAAIRFHTGFNIQPVLAPEALIDPIIKHYDDTTRPHAYLEKTLAHVSSIREDEKISEAATLTDEPIVIFVNQMLEDAFNKKCSDIHIEPHEHQCRIRFRQDGLLYEAAVIPAHLAARIVTRLKIMAQLNIAERRLPQDGRISWRGQQKLGIRVNTCPTLFGEKIVLRLLNNHCQVLSLDQLGMSAEQARLLKTALARPQGLILVTGPTGSGKTVTLYSILQWLNCIEKNISTVEDPVEIELPGINQINVHPHIGLAFSSLLRTLLRQDPDILMIGEIRDNETAAIAVQASQTGHLVLSTLHTNSAVDTLPRLRSMGIAQYQLASTLTLIIAQRLTRKLCEHCKRPHPDTVDNLYDASGCTYCRNGYLGRTGVFEMLPVTEAIADLITSNTNISQIKRKMRNSGWKTLEEAGLDKVKAGIISHNEFLRVIVSTHHHMTSI